jgi:hypothetical protein
MFTLAQSGVPGVGVQLATDVVGQLGPAVVGQPGAPDENEIVHVGVPGVTATTQPAAAVLGQLGVPGDIQ